MRAPKDFPPAISGRPGQCCAADATPMKVALVGGAVDGLVDDQWIAVDGRLRPGSATPADEYTPTLLVSAVRVVVAPADPYEY